MADKQNGSLRALCPSTETHQMQPGHTLSGSGFVCSSVPGYRNVPTRNWRPVGYIPVIIKQYFARCSSRYYPSMSAIIRFPYSAQEQRNVKEDLLRKT